MLEIRSVVLSNGAKTVAILDEMFNGDLSGECLFLNRCFKFILWCFHSDRRDYLYL